MLFFFKKNNRKQNGVPRHLILIFKTQYQISSYHSYDKNVNEKRKCKHLLSFTNFKEDQHQNQSIIFVFVCLGGGGGVAQK